MLFTDAALVTGYLFLHARAQHWAPAALAEPALTPAEVLDTAAILARQGMGEAARDPLLLAAAARAALSRAPVTALTKTAYDAARDAALEEWGIDRAQRPNVWPATSQTMMSRLGGGYWNAAVGRLGMAPNERGRARGLVRFTAEDYRAAVGDFLAQPPAAGSHSYVGYEQWQSREVEAGRPRPSGAAVRKYYGSWAAAKQAAR